MHQLMTLFLTLSALASITRDEFHSSIDKVFAAYKDELSDEMIRLKVFKDWENGQVGAFTKRGNLTWAFAFYGGLARQVAMTVDAMTLVACHELGHQLGGAPYFEEKAREFMSVEVQADYFASNVCLKKVWAKEENIALMASKKVSDVVVKKCRSKYSENKKDQSLCQRIATASLSFANVMRVIVAEEKETSEENKDLTRVGVVRQDHPFAQCRYDTLIAGLFNEERPSCWFH